MSATLTEPRATPRQTKVEWLATLDDLINDIEQWAAEEDWQVARLKKKTIHERGVGTYSVSDLRIRTHSGILNAEVVARDIVGADGRVDLISFPTMDRFVVVRRGDTWIVHDDARSRHPRRWSKKTFIDVAEELTKPQ